MSTRVLRKLQGESVIERELPNQKSSDTESDGEVSEPNKTKPCINRFNALFPNSPSESEVKEDDDQESEQTNLHEDEEMESVQKKKKKKKKKLKTVKPRRSDIDSFNEEEFLNSQIQNSHMESEQDERHKSTTLSEVLRIVPRNLNATNEYRRKMGLQYQRPEIRRPRGRHYVRPAVLVIPQKTWSHLGNTGISMMCTKCPVTGVYHFRYTHSPEYQEVQKTFLKAVEIMKLDVVSSIIQDYPYHLDSMIQLSSMYDSMRDRQRAAELIERALYCLENMLHPQFNFIRNNGLLYMDYRIQENRAFFVALFKHMIFVGERGCCRTSLELAKVILSLDVKEDPMAIVLIIDFYALLCHKYSWLLSYYEALEPSKHLSQLPNFAYSLSLTYFYVSLKDDTSKDVANKYIQNALIMYPGMLMPLLNKCSVEPYTKITAHPFFTSSVHESHSESLNQLIDLYIHRTNCLWKKPEVLDWLMYNAVEVLKRVDQKDPFVDECKMKRKQRFITTPFNVLRHIMLSNIKEVPLSLPQNWEGPNFCFDPVPPLDGINLYVRETRRPTNLYQTQSTLLLFLQSLLPSFAMSTPEEPVPETLNTDQQPAITGYESDDTDYDEDSDYENNDDFTEDNEASSQPQTGSSSSDMRHGVERVLHAMRDLFTVMQTPSTYTDNNQGQEQVREQGTEDRQ